MKRRPAGYERGFGDYFLCLRNDNRRGSAIHAENTGHASMLIDRRLRAVVGDEKHQTNGRERAPTSNFNAGSTAGLSPIMRAEHTFVNDTIAYDARAGGEESEVQNIPRISHCTMQAATRRFPALSPEQPLSSVSPGECRRRSISVWHRAATDHLILCHFCCRPGTIVYGAVDSSIL